MRLLLDEHISKRVAEQLRRRQHDVVAVTETEHRGMSDDAILAAAVRDRRAFVTNDIGDFRQLHAAYLASLDSHYGLIYVATSYRRSAGGIGRLVRALDTLLISLTSDDALQDREYFI